MAEPFYVLFRDGAPADWARAAQVLDLASPTLSRGDATRACRFGGGLIPAPLPEAEALQVASALDRAGFPAVLLPFHSLVRAPAPFVLSNADAYPDGFHIQVDLQGTMQTLPWASVRIVLVECVRPSVLPTAPLTLTTRERPDGWSGRSLHASAPFAIGLSLLAGAAAADVYGFEEMASPGEIVAGEPLPEPALVKPLEPEVWLELFALKPLMRLRIRQQAFNYDYLAERLTTSSRKNFALLLRDILQFTPGAAKVGQIGPVLASLPMNDPRKIIDQRNHEGSVTALLTREAIVGLPRPSTSAFPG